MKFKTECEVGTIKIYNSGMACFFSNNIGDVINSVEIIEIESSCSQYTKYEFLGHFTVKEKPVYLSSYDCSDEPIYEFKNKGRYFIYLGKNRFNPYFIIVLIDNETHS